MRRNPVAHKLEAVANVRDQKAHSALVWMAEKARQVNPRSTPIQYQFQGKIPLHMLKSITEVKGRGKGYTVRRSGKKVTVTSTGTPDSYCWIIEAEAPTRDKKVPIVFVIHEYPKRKKNPQANWTVPYLEKLITASVNDPTGWGESSPAARVLRQMVKSSGFGNLDPFPVDELWGYLASYDVDSDEIRALKKVRPPRVQKKKVGPTFYEAYRDFEQATGKHLILQNIDLETDHHLAPALLAITKAVGKLPPRSARIWQSEVKKVMLVGRTTDSATASWRSDGLIVLSLEKGARRVPHWRITLVHELGHALEDKLNLGVTAWSSDPYGQEPYVSAYAEMNASEDFAETFQALEMEPSRLRRVAPAKYEDMKSRLSLQRKNPKRRKNPYSGFIDELMQMGFEDYPWEEYPALIYRWEDGCGAIVNLQGSANDVYLGTIKISGVDKCFRQGYGSEAMAMIVEAADLHGIELKLIALPFGTMGMPPAKLKEWYKRFGFKMRRGSDEAMERSLRKNPKRRKNPKFKIGDRVSEGKRKGKVTAIHSPGTVDVLFDDMSYAIRRQAPNVRKR